MDDNEKLIMRLFHTEMSMQTMMRIKMIMLTVILWQILDLRGSQKYCEK